MLTHPLPLVEPCLRILSLTVEPASASSPVGRAMLTHPLLISRACFLDAYWVGGGGRAMLTHPLASNSRLAHTPGR